MIVAYNSADVIEYMGVITKHVDMSHPVLMDKYILGTECEVDAICDGTDYLVPGIMQQVERTGVHSGDSICVYPPYTFSQKVIDAGRLHGPLCPRAEGRGPGQRAVCRPE